MTFTKSICFILIAICSISAKAQEYDGELQFIGKNFLNKEPLNGTTIKVMSGSTTISEYNTKDKNNFKTTLAFGKIYDVYFINSLCQTMYININTADIPENKRYYRITYALDVPFFKKDPSIIDTNQFKNPFHKIIFDGKSRFIDDTAHMSRFLKNLYVKVPVLKKDTIVPIVKKVKELVQLTGKLVLNNDKQTPIKNKTVSLLNNKGDVISSSQTTNNGAFIFQNVDIEQADAINLLLNSNDNPNNDNIKLINNASEKIAISTNDFQTQSFKKNSNDNLFNKLINNDFNFNISGKLIASKGILKKIASDKNVYLMNSKNIIIQKTKTNALGNFLFPKIFPGQEYSIAYDSVDSDPSYIMNLYSLKDKFIKRLDSVSSNRFHYKFLAVSSSTFNDLVIDESELKMTVKGRLCGDNKSNPLSNLKVLLLNDQYEKIDSAVTDKNGDFTFKHVSYNKQFLITAENERNILESFSNILVFNNDDNLIKVVSTVKGRHFEYKPLSTEQSQMSDLYVDDPWLAIINHDKSSKNKVGSTEKIIENILFEFNKAELQPQSQLTLDKVVLAMLSNDKFNIELSAHSDSKGSDAYNLKLSEQRANASKNYIVSKGVNPNRIKAIGYGETKLLNNCGNTVICSEDEHAVNRRLEFVLIFN